MKRASINSFSLDYQFDDNQDYYEILESGIWQKLKEVKQNRNKSRHNRTSLKSLHTDWRAVVRAGI